MRGKAPVNFISSPPGGEEGRITKPSPVSPAGRGKTDASAAKGIASRRGLGKVRHIEVNQLWLQDKVNSGEIQVMKVKGEGNLADALTKPLEGTGTRKHLDLTGQEVVEGRHDLTPDFEAAGGQVTRRTYDEEEEEDEQTDELMEGIISEIACLGTGKAVLELLCVDKDTNTNEGIT